MSRIIRLAVFTLVLSASPVLSTVAEADEFPMWMSPFKLVLNAQGQFEDVEGNFAVGLPPGAFESFEFGLYFDDVLVSEAYAVRYCAIDDVLSVSFDRTALLANPDVKKLAGYTVEARVEGSLVVATGVEVSLFGYDDVEILGPGRVGPRR